MNIQYYTCISLRYHKYMYTPALLSEHDLIISHCYKKPLKCKYIFLMINIEDDLHCIAFIRFKESFLGIIHLCELYYYKSAAQCAQFLQTCQNCLVIECQASKLQLDSCEVFVLQFLYSFTMTSSAPAAGIKNPVEELQVKIVRFVEISVVFISIVEQSFRWVGSSPSLSSSCIVVTI